MVIYLSSTFSIVYLTSQYDYRMALLLEEPPSLKELKGVLTINEDPMLTFSLRNFFLERTAYWITGMRVFEDHPLLGVGLGNTGFFGQEKMPILGWSSNEIRTLFYRQDGLMNTKSLWVRLLSETGLVGFSLFGIWLYIHWRSASLLGNSRTGLFRWIGLAGQFFILALLAEGFSVDSFALPYLWFGTGLIAAAGLIYRQQISQATSQE
jgi:O-antigen ligase